jgi:hypothetical protein
MGKRSGWGVAGIGKVCEALFAGFAMLDKCFWRGSHTFLSARVSDGTRVEREIRYGKTQLYKSGGKRAQDNNMYSETAIRNQAIKLLSCDC